MSFSSKLVWEVRTTGSNLNSGGFVKGAAGTAYSQQDDPLIAFTDLAIDSGDNTKVSSSQVGFTPALAGNTLRISSGTGFTAGVYEIKSVSGGVATLDRGCGTAGSTGGSGRIGGATDINAAFGSMVANNTVWIKAGEHPVAGTPNLRGDNLRILGYDQTRGDISLATLDKPRPRIRVEGWRDLSLNSSSGVMAYLDFVPLSGLAGRVSVSARGAIVFGCRIQGDFSGWAVHLGLHASIAYCEVAGGGQLGIYGDGFNSIMHCYVHDGELSTGIRVATDSIAHGNVVARLTNNTSGISVSAPGTTPQFAVTHNTVYDCEGDGIRIGDSMARVLIQGNILARCGGYGINSIAPLPWSPTWSGNAFFNNTSGPRHNLSDIQGTDLILGANPFVDADSGDFRLNTDPDGGLLCRGAALSNYVPGLAFAGRGDMGAVQSEGESGGGPTVNKSYFWLEG